MDVNGVYKPTSNWGAPSSIKITFGFGEHQVLLLAICKRCLCRLAKLGPAMGTQGPIQDTTCSELT